MSDTTELPGTTSPAPADPQRSSGEGMWRTVLLAALVVALVVAAFALVPAIIDALERSGSGSPTTMSGTATVPAGERRATVALSADLTDDTVVSAGVVRRGSGELAPARVIGPTVDDPQFTVLLGRAARGAGASVEWKAAGLAGSDAGSASGWSTEWVVVLALMALSLLAALAAFVIAVRRRQAGADGRVDVGPELASFLKVAALLMIAALALIAVMLATDEKSLTGLFALLGTIAGYLAGNRSETTAPGRPQGRGRGGGRRGAPDPDGPQDQGGQGVQGEGSRMRPEPMFETRSLL